MRRFLPYYGAKWKIATWVISHFPPHKTYVDVFGGTGAILFTKPLSYFEVYNDLNSELVNFFKVVREQPEEFMRQIQLTLYAREEFDKSHEKSSDPLEQARQLFVELWMGINGEIHSKSGWRSQSHAGQTRIPNAIMFRNSVELIPVIVRRLQYIQIENRPYEYIIGRYDTKDTLFYLDPPYVANTRTNKKVYKHEFTEEDHIRLAELANSAKGDIVLSGYDCPLYTDLYPGEYWEKVTTRSQINGGFSRVESLWLSKKSRQQLSLF